MDLPSIDPLVAAGVVLSTAVTDAVYVFFNASVAARKRVSAATWSSAWYLLSAFAVISYTSNWAYIVFAAIGAWLGGFISITALDYVLPLERDKHNLPKLAPPPRRFKS
jgi:hypothetical protein